MTNGRVFWLVHGIKQRLGLGSTSPTAQAVSAELGGTSERVRFLPCCCARMQGRAACSAVGLQSICLGAWGFPHLGGVWREQQAWEPSGVLGRDPRASYSPKML